MKQSQIELYKKTEYVLSRCDDCDMSELITLLKEHNDRLKSQIQYDYRNYVNVKWTFEHNGKYYNMCPFMYHPINQIFEFEVENEIVYKQLIEVK